MENTRKKILENKIELDDKIIEEIIELPAESEGMNELPSYTEKNYRELSAVEKEDLINSLMKDDYLKYKNCYISRSKLLYDSSETLIKEISALSQLNELGYEIYLLPYSYARDSMNFYKKSADSITYGDFLELKSTISTNERAGQNCYEAGRKQADNIYISFVNDISEEKALKSIYGSIGNIKKGNRKHNIEDNFKGLLFLNFEKKGEIHLYDISKEGYVTKLENPSFENLKKILEDNKNSQVIVNPSNERRSPRDLNLHQDIESVNSKEYQNFQDKKMENYVITQERNGEISVLASSYKNAIFVGGDYLSDYETYNLEKVNNLLKDLQESNPDNEYRIITEDDFRQTYLLEKNKLTPTEYLAQKINASGINIHLSKEEMKAILEAGKDVQKLAVKYGTNQDISTENENTFNGYGTYVVSVNEENARQLGIKIASRKYGGTFYINNQPLAQFLREKNFSPYWVKRLEQLNSNSVDNLTHEIMMANVNGNAILEQEQNKLSTLLGLDLVEYKREQTYLYSVEIPDNNNSNYLLYNNPIGIDHATKINNELEKMGVEWRVSRNDIGKNVYFDVLSSKVFEGNQKATSEFLKENVGFVGMQMNNSNYIIFNDKDMSITDRVQYMKTENGEVYGFTFEGEIYVDEELVNSNVLAHEYTHIWDKFVQKNNPELWQKGMTCLKGTSLWYEITEDKNYENLRTDDEILSECHARIVGKMAGKILERIAAQDGELTRDKIIDWDIEVNEYVATELLIKPELGEENYISESVKAEYLKEFLSMPMKNLMNEMKLQIEKGQEIENKKNLLPGETIVQTSNQGINTPSPASTQNSEPQSSFNHSKITSKNSQYIINKLKKIKTNKIEAREFLEKIKYSFQVNDLTHSSYIEQKINNKNYVLRIANHSANAYFSDKKSTTTSLVIKLSEHYFGDSKENSVKEFIYYPENLTKDVKDNIIKGLVDWINTGSYSYEFADEIIMSTKMKNEQTKIQKYAETVDNSKNIEPEIPVVKGEIKSVLGNIFSGGNIQLTQDFQNELIEKGLVNPEDEFILINDEEAAAQGTKIKSDQPFVTLNIPVENNGKTDFVQTKYYHVSALEEFTQETEVKNEENQIQEEQPKIIIPEFAMITQHGLKTYTNMVVDNYEEHTKSYLLKSQDGQETVRITENTLKELTSNEHQQKAQSFDENTKAAEKMIETQYKDFFEPRKNCANNFRHNLSVFCRKEANSPLDALKVANSLISQMSKEEKRKTKDLLNLLRKDGQTVNEVIIDTYHEAVKEVPLNEEYLNNKRYDKMIARPMYDTISSKGQKLDRDFNLKIGDSVKVTFKIDKNAGTKFSLKKENLFQECTIISSSKEANKVTLMDGNKSFYDVPRDTFLQEYARREKNEHKQEQKNQRSRSMQIEIGR